MSRAAQQTTRNLTDQQLAQQNQLISQSNQNDQQDRSAMMPTITSLLNSQGYTPQQQSAITQQSMGAANTAVWGDGTLSTSTQTYNSTSGATVQPFTVYGTIPAQQNVAVSASNTYQDTITVTVTF